MTSVRQTAAPLRTGPEVPAGDVPAPDDHRSASLPPHGRVGAEQPRRAVP
ncbi:hypothetical protein [Streptomyces hydrogenans]